MVKFILSFLGFSLIWITNSFANVVIDSVHITNNTCGNNGVAKVYAHGNNLPFTYKIVAGPLLKPLQSSPIFGALVSGNYTVRAYNAAHDSAQSNFTITGIYTPLSFTSSFQNPFCKLDSSGIISGTIAANTGYPNYTWTLTNTTTNISITQTTDTFKNLLVGNYTLKLIDGCSNFSTQFVTLSTDTSRFGTYSPFVNKIVGCDTTKVIINIALTRPISLPILIKIKTKNGVITKPANVISLSSTSLKIIEYLNGIGYGDSITFTTYNSCHDSIVLKDNISPFAFTSNYFYSPFDSCKVKISLIFYLANTNTGMKTPLIYYFFDKTKNQIKYDTITDTVANYNKFISFNTDIFDTTKFHLIDGCGNVYTQTLICPINPPPTKSITIQPYTKSCRDSTASIQINTLNYLAKPILTLLSGPATIHSTKPFFNYTDSLKYNIPYQVNVAGTSFYLINLGVGVYHYNVQDTCGHIFNDSFEIKTSNINSMNYKFDFKRGCLGQNKIYFNWINSNIFNRALAYYTITNLQTGAALRNNKLIGFSFPYKDSIQNISAGKYALEVTFQTSNYYLMNSTGLCTTIHDTITVPAYTSPIISNILTTKCNGSKWVGIIADSTKGVLPFKYQIIAGPTLFPLQNSNAFPFTLSGTYTARMIDGCGNTVVYSFTIDTTFSFKPTQAGSLCNNSKVVLKCTSLPYFTYKWKKGNTLIHIGDSIIFNPFTFVDTGVYSITKYVSFLGCVDSTIQKIYLQKWFPNYTYKTICANTNFMWRLKNYTLAGNYYDTVKNINSCDSIYFLNLKVNKIKRDTINITKCFGDTLFYWNKSFTATGFYRDTFTSTLGCDSISVIKLKILNKISTAKTFTICKGKTYTLHNGNTIFNAGIYADTLTSSFGCDSILKITLITIDTSSKKVVAVICSNQTYTLPKGKIVSIAGNYVDTLQNYLGCDSIIRTQLIVKPISNFIRTDSICEGKLTTLPDGTKTGIAGTYNFTKQNYLGCDSNIIIHVIVIAKPIVSLGIDTSICIGSTLTLNAGNPGYKYVWNNLSQNQTLLVNSIGTYFVKVQLLNCPAVNDTITITEKDCNCVYLMPNAFTPNDDGIDDIIKPILACDLIPINYQFHIFNRWGQMVFATNDYHQGWNGNFNNRWQEISTYTYFIQFTNPTTHQLELHKGNIELLK